MKVRLFILTAIITLAYFVLNVHSNLVINNNNINTGSNLIDEKCPNVIDNNHNHNHKNKNNHSSNYNLLLNSTLLRNKRETYPVYNVRSAGVTKINIPDWNPMDNRKPAFKNCKDYAPKVKEEQPDNTYVTTVEAEDPDEKQTIKYSFVALASERPKFRIDSETGKIYTAHTFDRDEPIYEKEVLVTVQATDNGRPPLDDVCTFKITIEDINDNPPVFDKAQYDESMWEDTQVSHGFLIKLNLNIFLKIFKELILKKKKK